jgi:hypothetical protein
MQANIMHVFELFPPHVWKYLPSPSRSAGSAIVVDMLCSSLTPHLILLHLEKPGAPVFYIYHLYGYTVMVRMVPHHIH